MLKFYLLDHTRIHIIHDFHSHTVFHCFIYFTGGETYGSFPLHGARSEGLQFMPQASAEEETPSPLTANVEIDAATEARCVCA